jgi:SAM-dependent methyltransferase
MKLVLVLLVLFICFNVKNKFTSVIKDVYPEKMYVKIDNNYGNYKTTYGEMTYEGMDRLYKSLNSNFEYFLDVGSGNGHLCFYMAEKPEIKKSIGIEIVKERINFANKLLNNTKVSFINDDILNINIKNLFDKPVFVWWSNLCFDKESIDKISQKLISELKPGSTICSSKSIEYNLYKKETVKMTWGENNTVYIYKLN